MPSHRAPYFPPTRWFPLKQWGKTEKLPRMVANERWDERRRKRKKREMKNFLQSLLIHTSHRQLQTFHSQILFLSPTHTDAHVKHYSPARKKWGKISSCCPCWSFFGCSQPAWDAKNKQDEEKCLPTMWFTWCCCCCCCSVAELLLLLLPLLLPLHILLLHSSHKFRHRT